MLIKKPLNSGFFYELRRGRDSQPEADEPLAQNPR